MILNSYRFAAGGGFDGFGNNSRSFDGTNDYIDMGDVDGSIWQGSSGKMSVAGWVKGIPTGFSLLIGKYGTVPTVQVEWAIFAHTDGDLQVSCYGEANATTYIFERTDSAALSSSWVHIGMTFDATLTDVNKIKIAVNGSFVATTYTLVGAGGIAIQNGTEDLAIGARDEGTGTQYNGKLADFRIYSTILTESEFGDLASGVDVGTPWGHWLLDTDDVTDYGTAGNDGHSTADSTFDTDGPAD